MVLPGARLQNYAQREILHGGPNTIEGPEYFTERNGTESVGYSTERNIIVRMRTMLRDVIFDPWHLEIFRS
jgi:hypothetical protein